MLQKDPACSNKENLPTMYELPSEDPKESGLPDEFHLFAPQLLYDTFCPEAYQPDEVFVASDLNLYFDQRHTSWYKRPDWFAVVGNSRLWGGEDLRQSYVIWQERVSPVVVVELLSKGTENEDLGKTKSKPGTPPTKWRVYEKILRVPNYIVFDPDTNTMRAFMLQGEKYREINLEQPRIWIPEVRLGLGLWQGFYKVKSRKWLRWYDANDNWVLTPEEQERRFREQETQRAQQERQRADNLAARLRELGINPDDV